MSSLMLNGLALAHTVDAAHASASHGDSRGAGPMMRSQLNFGWRSELLHLGTNEELQSRWFTGRYEI